ncbi:hypothetical protein C8A03DRAFT_36044 [Achaetomium macrosporum]|uniref:Uncharacterized protein n=1 Tax=Achaetomium macrosporum TaxID=79813 RepID=A0AAN7C633_9PEZI|nr:hypothetical protein C8A03DRAFT_36044 [Achaetomium macrosporum]
MGATYTSAGGSAVVGEKDRVTYKPQGAVVSSPGSGKTTTVYIPITNPSTQQDPLTKVSVECKGTAASATDLVVYFGNTSAYSDTVPNGSQDFDLVPNKFQLQADAKPYGIDVSMDVSFTSDTGTFEIYSVTLQFGSP